MTQPRVTLLRRLLVASIVGLWLLGCSGWLSTEADMIGVDRELAVEQGYVVPLSAQKVFVRDRKSKQENVRTTWFRYRLPPQALADLRKDLSTDQDVELIEVWEVPDRWPDFASIGFEDPGWWEPKGQVYQQELTLDDAVAIPSGHMWALDDEEGEVYVWVWEWEEWSFEADQGLDPRPTPKSRPAGNDAVVEEAAADN
ncbi:MAG: hypothetical protein AAF602_31985 [Myxococcota bacterium]